MGRKRRAFLIVLMLAYALFLGYHLFFSNRTINLSWISHGGWTYLQTAMANKINLKPFATINNYFYKYSIGYIGQAMVWRNIGGNIIAFMPFALFFPAIYRKMRHRIPFYGFWILTLGLVEFTQYLTMSGALDIDDFILNMLGILVIYELFGHRIKTGGSQ
ncbi:MAG: VanZ family protein [Erysipelotrichaceae bacterium]